MKKNCLIRQPAGLGDIIFCQKIANLILKKGKYTNIIWPVIQPFNYIKDYLQVEDTRINFICEEEEFPHKELYQSNITNLYEDNNVLYIPLQHADTAIPTSCFDPMHVKYQLCNNLDYSDWKEYVTITRNKEREQALIDYLKVDINKAYVLINRYFGSPPNSTTVKHIKADFNVPIVEMKYLEFDNLFDWIPLMVHAQEIHTVDTSLSYIAEIMNLKTMHIYSRNSVTDFMYSKDLFSPDWEYYSL